MELNEIVELVNDVVKIHVDFYGNDIHKPLKQKDGNKYPEYYPGYNALCNDFDAIRNHAVKNVFPEKLFAVRSPNMTEREFEYVRANYKQISLPVYMDYLTSIKRAWNDNNWSVEYNEETNNIAGDNGFRYYIEKELPQYGSLENWGKNILPNIKSQDPNGVIVIRPESMPTKMVEQTTDNGQIILVPEIDDTIFIEPTPFYYTVKQKVRFKSDDWFLILTKRNSVVEYGGKKVREGLVFEFYDKNTIWFIEQTGKKIDNEFNAYLFYKHDLDKCPVTPLFGIPIVEESTITYQSPFLYAVDNLDLAVLNASNLQLAINNCVYPVRVMFGNECSFIDGKNNRCVDGMIVDMTSGHQYTCPSCNGTGLKERLSPNGTLLIRPPKFSGDASEATVMDPLKYVSPEVYTLDFLENNINRHETRARSILHLNDSSTSVTPDMVDPTATGRQLDEKSLFAFIKPISNEMFNVYEFTMNTIGAMRYPGKFKPAIVSEPQSFELLSESDYLKTIADAINLGLPPFVVYSIIYRYLNSVFFTEEKTSKAFNLVFNADRFLTSRDVEVQTKVANGTAFKWEEILHSSAIQLIRELEREHENFYDKPMDEQIQLLKDKAVAIANAIQVETDANNPALNIGKQFTI